jgi:hypothetical protein
MYCFMITFSFPIFTKFPTFKGGVDREDGESRVTELN